MTSIETFVPRGRYQPLEVDDWFLVFAITVHKLCNAVSFTTYIHIMANYQTTPTANFSKWWICLQAKDKLFSTSVCAGYL